MNDIIKRSGCYFHFVESDSFKAIHFSFLGRSFFICCLTHRGITGDSFHFRFSVVLSGSPVISNCHGTRCICLVLVFDYSWYFS